MRRKWLWIFIAVTGLLAILAVLMEQDTFYTKPQPSMPLVIAHRGASGHAPENTLTAVRLALEKRADLIEVDVHQSADEQVIVIHDPTLDRTTDLEGEVAEKSLAEIKKADAGSWFSSEFAGETVPTLEEILQLVDGQAQVLIEVKWDTEKRPYPGLEERVLAIIDQQKASGWCVIQSFDPRIVRRLLELKAPCPVHKLLVGDLPLVPLYFDTKLRTGDVFQPIKAAAFNPYFKRLSPRFLRQAHKRGKLVFTWTVNDSEDMRKMIHRGVDGIITNYPGRLRAILEE